MTLAEKCGTSTSYIGQIEIGNRFPSLNMIEKIAEALQISPYLLFIDESNENVVVKPPPVKTGSIPDSTKEELVKRLNEAIRKVVRQIK